MPKYIFLDRDGTILVDKHYLFKIEDLEFLPNAIEGLKKLQQAGCKFIIVTNQAGIAKGIYNEGQYFKFREEMHRRLKEKGIFIDAEYFCPHHVKGVIEKYKINCECRKPKPGLVKEVAAKFGINLSDSFFIGDKDCDIKLSKNCMGKIILINNGQYTITSNPDFTVRNLDEAADIILNLNQI